MPGPLDIQGTLVIVTDENPIIFATLKTESAGDPGLPFTGKLLTNQSGIAYDYQKHLDMPAGWREVDGYSEDHRDDESQVVRVFRGPWGSRSMGLFDSKRVTVKLPTIPETHPFARHFTALLRGRRGHVNEIGFLSTCPVFLPRP